jgi:hypothetical protein
LREALLAAALAALLVALATWLSGVPTRAALLGALLIAASAAFAFWGRDAGRALAPALILGTLPLACSLAAPHLGHVCTGSGCMSLCLPLCTTGGVAAGVLLTRIAQEQARPWRAWLLGAGIAALTGAMGCACVGLPSLAGMALGLAVPQAVSALTRQLRRAT